MVQLGLKVIQSKDGRPENVWQKASILRSRGDTPVTGGTQERRLTPETSQPLWEQLR